MARKSKGMGERHRKILDVLELYQNNHGYPPSIREIGRRANISSTSVVNYYLVQLEEWGYIERDRHVSRGLRLTDQVQRVVEKIITPVQQAAHSVKNAVDEMLRIPIIGRIVASEPVPVPASDFNYYDSETAIDVARSLLPAPEKGTELYALEVRGDSMIDAMVNSGDIVIMKHAREAQNGEMVAVWLNDKDETTLKYFYLEHGKVRLQPANPTMKPIYVDDPSTIEIQGKVVMVIRQV